MTRHAKRIRALDDEIIRQRAEIDLLEREVARLQKEMAMADHPGLDPAQAMGVKNYTCRYEDIDAKTQKTNGDVLPLRPRSTVRVGGHAGGSESDDTAVQ